MLTYRPFRNYDPPSITKLWRSCADQPGLYHPISTDLLEQQVFGKLYFDYAGLILAHQDERLVGLIHAGFGPNQQRNGISTEAGVHSLMIVHPECDRDSVTAGLIQQSEQYLQKRGARVLYGGNLKPIDPFYLGLYGGSELPGVLQSDKLTHASFQVAGYEVVEETLIFQRDLATFEALIDRRQMQIRRQMMVEVTDPIASDDWWEACTLGNFDLTRFELIPRDRGPVIATATFRVMEPTGTLPIGETMGLIDFRVEQSVQRRGLAIFLMTEAFRQFIRQGVRVVEVQCPAENAAACGFYEKLGFRMIGTGNLFRKNTVTS